MMNVELLFRTSVCIIIVTSNVVLKPKDWNVDKEN